MIKQRLKIEYRCETKRSTLFTERDWKTNLSNTFHIYSGDPLISKLYLSDKFTSSVKLLENQITIKGKDKGQRR